MKRIYISESHRKYSEECQKEVAEMSKHPLPADEKEAQMERNMRLSMIRRYMIESQRKLSEECKREVEKVASLPLTWEQIKAQCDRIIETFDVTMENSSSSLPRDKQ